MTAGASESRVIASSRNCNALRIYGLIPPRMPKDSKITVRLWPKAYDRLMEEMPHYRGDRPPVSEFVSRLIQDCPETTWRKVRESMDVKYDEWT